jgi:hypothetical protein
MIASKLKRPPKQADLFDSIPARPQWEKLPAPIRNELLDLLKELLHGPSAQQLLQQLRKGGAHER